MLLPYDPVLHHNLPAPTSTHITVAVFGPIYGLQRPQMFFSYIQILPGFVPVVMKLAVTKSGHPTRTKLKFANTFSRAAPPSSRLSHINSEAMPIVMHVAITSGFSNIVAPVDRTRRGWLFLSVFDRGIHWYAFALSRVMQFAKVCGVPIAATPVNRAGLCVPHALIMGCGDLTVKSIFGQRIPRAPAKVIPMPVQAVVVQRLSGLEVGRPVPQVMAVVEDA